MKKSGRITANGEHILTVVTCGLFAVLFCLSAALIFTFSHDSEDYANYFDIDMIKSDDAERADITEVFVPAFIGLTADGKREGISSPVNIVSDIFRTLSPTLAYILGRNATTEASEDEWNALASLSDSVYLRLHNELPEKTVRYFASQYADSEGVGSDNRSYVYEIFMLPYSVDGDIATVYTRSLDGDVLRYTVYEPETFITASEIETYAGSYSSFLSLFSFPKGDYSSLSYTEPLFTESVSTVNLTVTVGTAYRAYATENGVAGVLEAFGMNTDKVLFSYTEDDGNDGYIDSGGVFYIRDSAFEYRGTAGGGIKMSDFIGYTEGKYTSVDYIAAAVSLWYRLRAIDRSYTGADADVYLSSVTALDGTYTVELSYCVENTPFFGTDPALVAVYSDGVMKEARVNTLDVRVRTDSSRLSPEEGFALHLDGKGLHAYNVCLKYCADRREDGVRAEWIAECAE